MTVVCIDIVCIIISYVHGGYIYIYICGCCLLCIAVYKHYNYLFFTWQYLFAHEKLQLFLWKIEDRAYKLISADNAQPIACY